MRNSSPVVLGEIIADKYQIEGVIGEGGMGIVVSAWHLGLRQRVAIKLLLSEGGRIEAAALERFQREARAAARIRSEHVCRVLDVGMLPDGTPYLVMEYLEGCDLADELSRRGKLPPYEAIAYVLEGCEALAEAHLAGIIHRDLKPANLFLSRRGNGSRCLKLLDFGVSKSITEGSTPQLSLTKTSSIVGSPIYMSPEQLNSSKDVDLRTDIWALGALTFELIAGRPPFFAETIPQLVSQVLHADPPSFAELGVDVPAGLEAVLRKALSKPRDERYANVGEFATELAAFAPDDSISISRILNVRPPSDSRDPLPETIADQELRRRTAGTKKTPGVRAVETTRVSSGISTRPQARTRRWPYALAALLLIALAGAAAAFSRRGDRESARRDDTEILRAGEDAGTPRTASMLPPQLPSLPEATPAVVPEPPAPPSAALMPVGATPPADATPPPEVAKPARTSRTKKGGEPSPAPVREESATGISNFGGRR